MTGLYQVVGAFTVYQVRATAYATPWPITGGAGISVERTSPTASLWR